MTNKDVDDMFWAGIIFFGVLFFLLFFVGCSTPSEVISRTIDNVIRIDTVKVTLPQETVFDTVYINNGQGESVKYIVRTDSVRVYVRGKEKIIYVPVTDTITVTKTEIKTVESDDFFKGVTMMGVLYVLGGVALLGFVGRLFGR